MPAALDRTGRLMRVLRAHPDGLPTAEAARLAGMSTATLHRAARDLGPEVSRSRRGRGAGRGWIRLRA